MPEQAYRATAKSQLERLAVLTDVVYAVALVLIISWLPLPEDNIVAVVIGLVFSIMYWIRSNTLMTALDRTDGVHTGLSIASVFFLLLLLYTVRVSAEVAAPSRRAGESVAVALIGVAAGLAWWWARRKGLVREGISKEEMLSIQLEAFTEPLTALVTLPFAYVGELTWNLAWFAYIPVAAFLRRRGVKEQEQV
jgi:hypothetical protein